MMYTSSPQQPAPAAARSGEASLKVQGDKILGDNKPKNANTKTSSRNGTKGKGKRA